MKTLAVILALIGPCCLAQPSYAQSNTFCEGFLRSGDRTDLAVYIQYIDREAAIVRQERDYELAGIAMSNVDLTKSVKDLETSVRDVEKRTERIDPSDIKLLYEGTDNLRDRVRELEDTVESQTVLLDKQRQQIEDLRKQIDWIRAEPVKKPRQDARKTNERPGP